MPIVLFRPHTLSLLTQVDGGYDAATGDYTPGSGEWSDRIPCRYEPNGKASVIPVGEDKGYVYEYAVYLDVDCPAVTYGQIVRIFDGEGNSIGDFRVKGFHRHQLNATLWV